MSQLTTPKAIEILETQKHGIPFETIEFLQNQSQSSDREKVLEKIIFAINHAYDDIFYNEQENYYYSTVLWYMIVAENYLCENLIDPVISLFTTSEDDGDFESEQGMFLIGKLAEKYPELTNEKVIKAIDKTLEKENSLPTIFLFDAFYFVDKEKIKSKILEYLAHENMSFKEMLAHVAAEQQIKEAKPIIKKLIEEETFSAADYRECLEQLKTGVDKYPGISGPYCKKRENWKEHYKRFEDRFSREAIKKNEKEILEDDYKEDFQEPIVEDKIGRNQLCPCRSGKKYKKCCLSVS